MIYRLSPQAEDDIDAIEKYYKNIGNPIAGDNIIDSIECCIKALTSHPYLGHLETMLEEFPQCFRTLVNVPNYKIIYWMEEDIVKIATVFDCRQHPMKMYRIISEGETWLCEP